MKRKIQRLTKDYINDIREIIYYNKLDRKFKRKYKKVNTFCMKFQHDIFAGFCKDNESKIEAIANANGFDIVDEKIFSTCSTYCFKKRVSANREYEFKKKDVEEN